MSNYRQTVRMPSGVAAILIALVALALDAAPSQTGSTRWRHISVPT